MRCTDGVFAASHDYELIIVVNTNIFRILNPDGSAAV